MHPNFTLWSVAVSSWGALAVVGVVVGIAIGVGALRQTTTRAELPWAAAIELAVVVVLAGFLGAKVGHVLFEAEGHALPDGTVATSPWSLLQADPWHWARLLEPGFVQLAGVVTAVGLGLLYLRRQGLWTRVAAVADAAALGTAAGLTIGRLGCLLAGCCHGRATDVWWAITYPTSHATGGAPVHPTPLYDSASAVVAMLAWRVMNAQPAGNRALVVAAVLGVCRVVTELWRGDVRGVFGPLSTSQLLGASIAVVAVVGLVWRAHRSRAAGAAAGPSS